MTKKTTTKPKKKTKRTIVEREYKVWMVIEERTLYSDDKEKFRDLTGFDDTMSVGTFKRVDAARHQLQALNEMHKNDTDLND